MIKLGEYKLARDSDGVCGGHIPYKEFAAKSKIVAEREWNASGVKATGWDGYLVIQTPTDTFNAHMITYYYKHEPKKPWMSKFKINVKQQRLETL